MKRNNNRNVIASLRLQLNEVSVCHASIEAENKLNFYISIWLD